MAQRKKPVNSIKIVLLATGCGMKISSSRQAESKGKKKVRAKIKPSQKEKLSQESANNSLAVNSKDSNRVDSKKGIGNPVVNEKEKAELELIQLKKTYGIVLGSIILIIGIIFYFNRSIKTSRKKRDELLLELEQLKQKVIENGNLVTQDFQLNKDKIEQIIQRKLNETDWLVLNLLLENPVISNKEIAAKAFMSVDGIGSSLRRMYEYFNTKESKYKKISLIMDAIKYSNSRL